MSSDKPIDNHHIVLNRWYWGKIPELPCSAVVALSHADRDLRPHAPVSLRYWMIAEQKLNLFERWWAVMAMGNPTLPASLDPLSTESRIVWHKPDDYPKDRNGNPSDRPILIAILQSDERAWIGLGMYHSYIGYGWIDKVRGVSSATIQEKILGWTELPTFTMPTEEKPS